MERIMESTCKEVFDYFQELNQIPRGSGNEQAVSDWLVAFAKDLNLEVIQDEALNVIIRKPGTEGYEESDVVILQGHMDMVPEKAEGSDHDFERDPIEFIVEGDFVRANQTTLGADNGIAVAYALTILASKEIPHPPLEVLITTNEETGMDGALGLNPAHLQGRKLINIDSEVEGELLVSCAGGIGAVTSLDLDRTKSQLDTSVEIKVSGLKGGHSGMEIHKQRGNAVQILGRVLSEIAKEVSFEMISIEGGSKHNAIPLNAVAQLILAQTDIAAFKELTNAWTQQLKEELHGIDEGVEVVVTQTEAAPQQVMTQEVRDKVLAILNLTPTGVLMMSQDIERLVQTSNNLGIVRTKEDQVTFQSTVRSSIRSLKFEVANRLEQLANLAGAKIDFDGGYPEWQYRQESELREVFVAAYQKQYGQEPVVTALHAGLECGVFSEKFEGKIDQISFGPNLFDVHTAQEKMEISSVERTFDLLKTALAMLK